MNLTCPGQVPASQTRGLLTGSKITTLGIGSMLLTVNYYDKYGQVLQSKSENHLGGTDEVSNSYSFAGKLTASTRVHTVGGVPTTIATPYAYDHVGRKIATGKKINNQEYITLNRLVYNELGQLESKKLHNDMQSTGLVYNERGWLKNSTSNEFSMQLDYQDGSVPQWNGNIANQYWGSGGSLPNVFSYSYDKLNRLTRGAVSPTILSEVITYDEMGNIKSLNRDNTGANTYAYTSGNRLGSVAGLTGSYGYDANGNATTDGRNGMTLTYNHLNLPITANKSGMSLAYTYNAAGQKLTKSSNGTIRQYVNGIEYKPDGSIDFIHTEEGVARRSGTNYIYEYNLSDHLGNVRYTFNQNGAKLQADDYSPLLVVFYGAHELGKASVIMPLENANLLLQMQMIINIFTMVRNYKAS